MEGKYKARIEETIHQLVAELLMRRVKDPRVANSYQRLAAFQLHSIQGIENSGYWCGFSDDVVSPMFLIYRLI